MSTQLPTDYKLAIENSPIRGILLRCSYCTQSASFMLYGVIDRQFAAKAMCTKCAKKTIEDADSKFRVISWDKL